MKFSKIYLGSVFSAFCLSVLKRTLISFILKAYSTGITVPFTPESRSIPALSLSGKIGRIGNKPALIGESLCLSEIQRGLVGTALTGRGERDKFSTGRKMVRDDPDLHMSYV